MSAADLTAALSRPKERESVLRLEAELIRLCNDASQQRLEMQPMSAQNRKLVQAVADRFGLQFAVPEVAPGASADDKRPVYLTKCAETHVPADRLAETVPAPDKVQLMRRPDSGAHGKATKAKPVHDLADEQARVKQREDAYEAARQRIFGGTQSDAGAPSSEPPAAVSAPANGGGEQTRQAEAANGEAPKPPANTQRVYNSVAQRQQDAMDPAFRRGAVRWTPPAAPPGMPMPYPGAMHYGYPEAAMQAGYLGNGHADPRAASAAAPRYSQYASWGMQPQGMQPQQSAVPSLAAGMTMSMGSGMSSNMYGPPANGLQPHAQAPAQSSQPPPQPPQPPQHWLQPQMQTYSQQQQQQQQQQQPQQQQPPPPQQQPPPPSQPPPVSEMQRALAQTEQALSQLTMRQQQLQQAVAALPSLTPEQQTAAQPQLVALHQRQQAEHAQLLELQRSQMAALQAASPA